MQCTSFLYYHMLIRIDYDTFGYYDGFIEIIGFIGFYQVELSYTCNRPSIIIGTSLPSFVVPMMFIFS